MGFGVHGLRVWPISALGFQVLRLNRMNFWILRCVTGCKSGQLLCSGLMHFIEKRYIFRFSQCEVLSLKTSFRMPKELARESLKMKILEIIADYLRKMQIPGLWFFSTGFSAFS